MFDTTWLDEVPWRDIAPEPKDTGQLPASRCVPSGWLALELDQGCVDPTALSDVELIEGIIGFGHVASWAGGRQATLLAEFARRRPGDHPLAAGCDTPSRAREIAVEGTWRRLLTDPASGTLLDHGRTTDSHPPPGDDPPPF